MNICVYHLIETEDAECAECGAPNVRMSEFIAGVNLPELKAGREHWASLSDEHCGGAEAKAARLGHFDAIISKIKKA